MRKPPGNRVFRVSGILNRQLGLFFLKKLRKIRKIDKNSNKPLTMFLKSGTLFKNRNYFLDLLRPGVSFGILLFLQDLGIRPFSSAFLSQSLGIILHPLSVPGKTGGVESSALAGVNI
jgi:hypothetical protein